MQHSRHELQILRPLLFLLALIFWQYALKVELYVYIHTYIYILCNMLAKYIGRKLSIATSVTFVARAKRRRQSHALQLSTRPSFHIILFVTSA